MIAADLFSGVGGLSQGFMSAGFEIAFAIEFDKEIADAYASNHPGTEMINEDICGVDASQGQLMLGMGIIDEDEQNIIGN